MRVELLYEPSGLPALALPAALAELYPGTLGFGESCVFANFVGTVDGVVAIPSIAQSNKLIAAGSEADRFVMGLLRACADVVLVGSGTLAASPRGLWTAAQAFPSAAGAFAELRAARGLPPEPEVAILSASAHVDFEHPVFAAGAVLLTTEEGAARAAGRVQTVSAGVTGAIEPAATIAALRARGHRLILHEGGPHAIGTFFEAGVVDELFLTLSPLLAGRTGLDPRLALVEGVDLSAGGRLRLLGVRKETGHLFLRYAIIHA